MPLPQHILNEIGERREGAERLARRDTSYAWARTLALCWMWSLLGLFGVAWGLHLNDRAYGLAAFWGGLAVGNGGILFTLIAAWRAAERRGDR